MSRPPRPHFDMVSALPRAREAELDYLPLEYGELLELTQALGAEEFGDAAEPTEGNLTHTLFELSALVAHVLAVYQDSYAGEAFLRTANAPSSLVRHARRLAYTPDVGLSATGYLALFAKPGLRGTVDAGLELASARKGDVPPQSFETLDPLVVDAQLNELFPADAMLPVSLQATTQQLTVEGVGLGLGSGDVLCVIGTPSWRALTIEEIAEDRATRTTVITLKTPFGTSVDFSNSAADALRILTQPTMKAYSFGWSADRTLYPQGSLRNAGATAPSGDGYWYQAELLDGSSARSAVSADHYLARVVEEPLVGSYLIQQSGGTQSVVRVTKQLSGPITFQRKASESVPAFSVQVRPEGTGFNTTIVPVTPTPTQSVQTHLSATVSVLQLEDQTGARDRSAQPLPATWLGAFRGELRVSSRTKNTQLLGAELELLGLQTGLSPGRRVIFSNLSGTVSQTVLLSRVQLLETTGRTRISWQPIDPLPAGGFRLHDLKVLANVVQIIHGRTQRELLGDSDGVSPFQRFGLRKWPVSMRPAAAGASPQIEVRVNDVAWQRVVDFFASGPDDRHYRLEIDDQQQATVVFGDGVHGAIPPAGSRNVSAAYKVGLGLEGNVDALAVARIKSPQTLLERAFNPGAISGGTERAQPDDVRKQATRYIRTFDRAVSVSDHADLALLFPGVVRSAARWDAAEEAIVLVAATALGGTPPPELRAFLDQRRDTSVRLYLRGPEPRPVAVALQIVSDPAFLFESVRFGIQAALLGEREVGLFTFAGRALGQPAYLSELQAAVEAVPGVVSARISRFSSREEAGLYDLVQAGVDQWLSLSAHDLTIQKGESEA